MSVVRATSEHSLGYDDYVSHDGQDLAAISPGGNAAVVIPKGTTAGGSRKTAGKQGRRVNRASRSSSQTAVEGSGNRAKSVAHDGEIAPTDVDVVVSFRNKKQSIKDLMDDLYEAHTQQVGYQTDGHLCVHNADKQEALHMGASLLYGEVLFEGVSKMLSSQYLAAANSDILYDLGMGTGKLALQAFFEFPNLKHVVGVEIAFSRYNIAERCAVNLVAKYPSDFKLLKWQKGNVIAVATVDPETGEALPENERRVLEFRREDLFKSIDAIVADIIILQTDFPVQVHDALCSMASRFRRGTRVLSYLNFHKIWDCEFFPFPFASFAPNARFPTSWSPTNGGHMFYLWRKVMPAYRWHNRKSAQDDESKFDGFVGIKKMSSLQFHRPKPHKSRSNSNGSSHEMTHAGGGANRTEGGKAQPKQNIFKCLLPKKKHRNRSSSRVGGGR